MVSSGPEVFRTEKRTQTFKTLAYKLQTIVREKEGGDVYDKIQ